MINTPNAYEKCRPWHAHPGFGSGLLGDNGLGAFTALLMREIEQVNDDGKEEGEGEEAKPGEAVVVVVEEWVAGLDEPGAGRLAKVMVVLEESEAEEEESEEESEEEVSQDQDDEVEEEAELLFEVFSLYYWNGYLVTLLAEGWSSKDAAVLVRGLYPDISAGAARAGRGLPAHLQVRSAGKVS